jgi:hypothetical protein
LLINGVFCGCIWSLHELINSNCSSSSLIMMISSAGPADQLQDL